MTDRRSVLLVAAGAVLGSILVVLFLDRLSGSSTIEAVFYLEALVAPISRLAVLMGRERRLDILDPYVFLPITVGATFGTGPAVLRSEGRPADAELLAAIGAGGLGAYFAGVVMVGLIRRLGNQRSIDLRSVSPGIVSSERVVAALFGLGTVAMVLYWASAGMVPALAADVENARIAALTGAGIPFYVSMMLMTAVWWSYATEAFTPRIRIYLLMVAMLLLASTGWRNTPFALIAVSMLISHYNRGFRHASLALSAAAITTGAAAIGIYRVVASNIQEYQTYKLVDQGRYGEAILAYFSSYTATFSRNLADVLSLSEGVIRPQHGETFVWNFLALIPGQEREPFDFVLKEASGQGFQGGGLPPTLFGEWVINFGSPGLVIGMFLVGGLSALAHRAVVGGQTPAVRVAGILICYYTFVSVRGGIGNVALTVVWLLITVAAARLLSQTARSTSNDQPKWRGRSAAWH